MSQTQTKDEWWRGGVLYQIYPRSFKDTNGDGIGDLPGITDNLEYVASLGVDGIWISPFYPSPMKDFGYDVSDYTDIDPIFGTLADFDALLHKAHGLRLKIIIDLVLSHTSDQHPWFQESAQGKDNPKSDWYVWADPKNGGPPNNWVSVFGGPAWTYHSGRGQYYLHNFLSEQPDLNFHNVDVQQAVLDVAKFWLDRGVDGFRLDVVNFYFHDQMLRDNPPREFGTTYATQFEGEDPYSRQQHIYDKSRPENLLFIERLRRLIDSYPGRMTVGEIGDDEPYARAAEYTAGSTRLHTCYNTDMMSGARKRLTANLISAPVKKFAEQPHKGHASWAFTNHDVVRAVSRWQPEGDGFGHDPRMAQMLNALLGCLPGTVFMYQGEELGLPEAKLAREDLRDPWGIALYPQWQGRDGCRTPMPWTDSAHGGFSAAKPWLPTDRRHVEMNVTAQNADPDSTLNFTRRFMQWRQQQAALRSGSIEWRANTTEDVLCFSRSRGDTNLNFVFNLSSAQQTIPFEFHNLKYVFGAYNLDINEAVRDGRLTLPPFAFCIFE